MYQRGKEGTSFNAHWKGRESGREKPENGSCHRLGLAIIGKSPNVPGERIVGKTIARTERENKDELYGNDVDGGGDGDMGGTVFHVRLGGAWLRGILLQNMRKKRGQRHQAETTTAL